MKGERNNRAIYNKNYIDQSPEMQKLWRIYEYVQFGYKRAITTHDSEWYHGAMVAIWQILRNEL